jgi:hypothetical protein
MIPVTLMPEVRVTSASLSTIELKQRLEMNDGIRDSAIELRITQNRPRLRGIEPTVLVALVSAGGTALGALITGLLQVARESHSSKIVVQGKDGKRLEFPADTPLDKIEEFKKLIKELDSPSITLN